MTTFSVSSLIESNIIKYLSLISTTCDIGADVIGVQFVAGALFDHATEQFSQRVLLGAAEHAEDLRIRGDRVADHGLGDLAPLIGEEGLQYPAVLWVLFALHQAATLELLERQLDTLGADEEATRQVGTGQAGLGGQLPQHADLCGADA